MEKRISRWWQLTVVAAGLSVATSSMSDLDTVSRNQMSPVVLSYVGMHIREASRHGLWASARSDSWRLAKTDIRGASETAFSSARVEKSDLIVKLHPDLAHDARRAACVMSTDAIWVCKIAYQAVPDTSSGQERDGAPDISERPRNWHAVGVGTAPNAYALPGLGSPKIVGSTSEPIRPVAWPSHMMF
jgi:hypothetical protein